MKEPKWVLRTVIEAMHDMQLAEHGGAPGIRDEGLLESALSRPQHQFTYGETDLYTLAASYACGLVRNHPYVDGNKRTAFLAVFVFLKINGFKLTASEVRATTVVIDLAAGGMNELAFAQWLRENSISG